MIDTLQLVREFHEMVNHPVLDKPDVSHFIVNVLRIQLLQEELDELVLALHEKDIVGKALDALTDLQYVLDGAYLALGFHKYKEAAFIEVHRANMSKAEGRLRDDGKAMKGPNYRPPNLEAILNGN